MIEPNTPAVAPMDAAGLTLSAYRALRESKPVPAAVPETKTAAEPPAAAATAEEPATNAATEDGGEADKPESQTSEEPKDNKEPKKDKLKARFSELTSKIKTLELQLADAKSGRTGQEGAAKDGATKANSDNSDSEPDPSKYKDYDTYTKEMIDWRVRQATQKINAKTEADRLAAQKQQLAAAKAEHWDARVSEAKTELADFDAVAMNKDLPVTPTMAEAIKESDLGAKVLYHLGKNPAEAERIAKLSPLAQVRELGKIEAKLDASGAAAEKEPQTQKQVVSRAPAPHKPVAAAPAASAKSIDSMSQAEYRALRESGKLR
jgi:hypothetical protein